MLHRNKLFNFKFCFYSYQQQQKIKKSSLKILPSTSIDHQKRAKNIGKKFFKILFYISALGSNNWSFIKHHHHTSFIIWPFFYNHGLFLDTSSVQEPSFVIKLTLLLILGIECIVSKLLQYIPDNKRYFYRQFVSTLHSIDFLEQWLWFEFL